MNPQLIRIKKESRALLWPWCAVVCAGALPIILPHEFAEPFSFLSFFMGIPLLATLSLGSEFQHHTISLWLTQPLSRVHLWQEKMMVMCPAVVSAALVSGIVMFSVTWPHMRLTYRAAAIVYVMVVMASSTLWTLATKSSLGALALFASILFFGMLFSGGVDINRRNGIVAAFSPAAMVALITVAGACIASVMLWLGIRRLARFQVAWGSAEGDLLTAGPDLMPTAFGDWLRPRPSEGLANLIRKELRLLRPVWVIELIVVVYVACLATFRLLPAPPVPEPRTVLEWVLLGPLASTCIAIAGLAGILSLGEEKTSGTYSWHRTLPVSAFRQWFIKLVIGMFAGLGCSLVFPVLTMMAVGIFYGSPFLYVNVSSLVEHCVLFSILTFICFWSACAANGTIGAIVCAFPVSIAVAAAGAGGLWLGRGVAFRVGTLKDFVISTLHLSPYAFTAVADSARSTVLWMFVPTLLFAVFQSYRLFRARPQSSLQWLLRCCWPPLAVAILWTFSVSAGLLSSTWQPFSETRAALDMHIASAANSTISGDDVASDARVSPATKRWLRGSRLTIAPASSHSSSYVVTIDLASGLQCRLTAARSGGTAARCGI